MRYLLLVMLFCSSAHAQLPFQVLPDLWTFEEESTYTEILSKAKRPIQKYDRPTNAHETSHRISGEVRVSIPGHDNSFFVPYKGVVTYPEPDFSKSQIGQYVPTNLRDSIFNTYVRGQTVWNNQPLYILDEFSAFINDDIVFIEDRISGKAPDKRTKRSVSACLEMSVYTVAMVKAIKIHDPDHWESSGIKPFIKLQLQRAEDTFCKGFEIGMYSDNNKQKAYLERFRNSPLATILDEEFDGVWTEDSYRWEMHKIRNEPIADPDN